MPKIKEPTCVSVVEAFVREADDFVTAAQVVEGTRLNPNQVSASLIMLKKYKAFDCFESDGKLWWYSTPELDARMVKRELRAPETKPRKTRKSASKPATVNK